MHARQVFPAFKVSVSPLQSLRILLICFCNQHSCRKWRQTATCSLFSAWALWLTKLRMMYFCFSVTVIARAYGHFRESIRLRLAFCTELYIAQVQRHKEVKINLQKIYILPWNFREKGLRFASWSGERGGGRGREERGREIGGRERGEWERETEIERGRDGERENIINETVTYLL